MPRTTPPTAARPVSVEARLLAKRRARLEQDRAAVAQREADTIERYAKASENAIA